MKKDEENRRTGKERKEREEMKQVKSYTSIWNVEKVIHAIGDINLLFPVDDNADRLFYRGCGCVFYGTQSAAFCVYKKHSHMDCDMYRNCISDVKKEL